MKKIVHIMARAVIGTVAAVVLHIAASGLTSAWASPDPVSI
ncbi:hypothetical protein [Protofrankia coriariae]|nr:hypothetical protein [Protofrankia coriariae]